MLQWWEECIKQGRGWADGLITPHLEGWGSVRWERGRREARALFVRRRRQRSEEVAVLASSHYCYDGKSGRRQQVGCQRASMVHVMSRWTHDCYLVRSGDALLTSGTVEVLEPVSTGCMASVWLQTTRLPNPGRLTKGSTSAGRPVARTGKEKSARSGRVRSLSLMELQKLEDLLRQLL